jgi:hypothetical protein
LQHDVDTVTTARPIEIFGINEAGQEAGNGVIGNGTPPSSGIRTIPWLQDLPRTNVWHAWQATWRDVIVLDADNKVIVIYNLTDHDLGVPANYQALRTALIDAAQATP